MLLVYCDTGAYDKRLSELEASGLIAVHQFKYENRSRRIRRGAILSDLRYSDKPTYTYDDMRADEYLRTLTYDGWRNAESRYNKIAAIVGGANRTDAQHLDSAYMTGCRVFLTSDKKDIWSKRVELQAVTGLQVFHVGSEWEAFIRYVQSGG